MSIHWDAVFFYPGIVDSYQEWLGQVILLLRPWLTGIRAQDWLNWLFKEDLSVWGGTYKSLGQLKVVLKPELGLKKLGSPHFRSERASRCRCWRRFRAASTWPTRRRCRTRQGSRSGRCCPRTSASQVCSAIKQCHSNSA